MLSAPKRLSIPSFFIRPQPWLAGSLRVSGFILLLSGAAAAQSYTDLQVTNKLKLELSPSASAGLRLGSDGLLIGRGVFGTDQLVAGDLPSGGSLLLWNPGNAAFRAGYFQASQLAQMGQWSVAFSNATATGAGARALGIGSVASNYYSVATGYGAVAAGFGSFAAGGVSIATGTWSTSIGLSTSAVGGLSMASGYQTMATGGLSTTMGFGTQAEAYASLAIGKYNVGGFNASAQGDLEWVDADPVFEIGNGNGGTYENDYQPVRSNALTVYKNGNATFQGVVRVAAGGDIPMFQP